MAIDAELADLPLELRWREWMGRVEAVLFASASPVSREDLGRVVGREVRIELLIDDIVAELQERPYELVAVPGGWMLRTRARFAAAIVAAADVKAQLRNLSEVEVAVLAAVAYRQPIDRDGLAEMFGGEISRDLIGRLRRLDLIATSPRAGAPYTYVTTDTFLAVFDLANLRDLPDREALEDAGLADPARGTRSDPDS